MYGTSRFRRGSHREDNQAKRSFDRCLQQLQKLQLESPDIPESEKIKMFQMVSSFTRILHDNIGSSANNSEQKGHGPPPQYYPPPPPQPQIIPMPIPMPQYNQPPPPPPQQNTFQHNPFPQQFQPNYPAQYRRPNRYDSDDDSSDDMSYFSMSSSQSRTENSYRPSHLKKTRVKPTGADYVPSQSRESNRLDRQRRTPEIASRKEPFVQRMSPPPKENLRMEPKKDPLEAEIENPFTTPKTQAQNQNLLTQVGHSQYSQYIAQNEPVQVTTQEQTHTLLRQVQQQAKSPQKPPPAMKSNFTSDTFEMKVDKDIVQQKFKQILKRIDMPLNRLFKAMSGDGTSVSRASMHAYLRSINSGMSLNEVNAFLGDYDRNENDALTLLEFQKIVVNLVGVEYIERLNCKHLSNINTDYTDTQKSIMKTILQAFENKKLPLSRQFQLFVKHSPNDRVNADSMHSCLGDDYNIHIPKEQLQELVDKFDVNPNGLSRASFTKLLSTSRVV